MNAILLVSHGSRFSRTKEEVAIVIDGLKAKLPGTIVDLAFLELETPSIPEGIERCISQKAHRIIILLNFLNSGRHVDEDIPAIVEIARQKHPEIDFLITSPVGQHPQIIDLFIDLIPNEKLLGPHT